MRKIFIQNLIMALFLAGLLVSVTPASAFGASIKDDFTIAWKQFHALTKDKKKSKYRSEWEKVAKKFRNVFKKSTRGKFAPKSLYYLGRTYEELGNRSGMKKDFRTSIDYYGRMISNFPSHSWTDDSIFRRAEIRLRKLREKDLAYSDYLTIVHRYSKSDMFSKARARLDSMDRKGISSGKKSTHKKPSGTIIPNKVAKSSSKKSSSRAKLLSVRYTSSESYTRVVLDLDDEVSYRYQILNPNQSVNRPHRLYVDLENTVLGNGVHKATHVADGILKDIRSAQKDPRTTRVVLDFNSMQDYKIFPLENPFRLVIDVQAPEKGKVAVRKTPAKRSQKTSKPQKYTPPKNSKQMAGELLEQLGLTFKTIMLDPGHGGKDPGASANGIKEKNVNLRFTKILAAKLKKAGFTVLYTRTTDKFIPLEERTGMANVKKADMFISVHCNAHRSSKINGIETYTLNLARNRNAVRVAARENAVSAKRISDLQVILTDLMLNSKMKESKDLAKSIHSKSLSSIRKRWSVKDQGVREAPFYVLMGAKMPSVLIELGYLTNRTEAKRLKSDKYLAYIADGIVKGVLEYKKRIERYASL
ncbi:N-acetylmuramoyl-L-alanine amidase [Maridesulfovibrio hydrothermalis]|uniref:N-acetylmuramoyl-L-alanine amidase n=1 Tax=Maridesulfovibrio hydrothermalis AM13 = DSM 14728 TaxID=1121451 RepID=L0RCG5_9BACT|nr:N-acetylmuramoyl-L-alanine amidase [Maridesulfovibrio hydrothermalis]CCO23271.1 N-acetylmuramoyl-L-alanine amidase [Maridesulfovibrio hydrothermalis AM13 = DSM 14728]